MAAVQPDYSGLKSAQCFETHLALPNGPEADVIRVGDPEVRVHVVQVPLERFTLQVFSERQAFLDAGNGGQ